MATQDSLDMLNKLRLLLISTQGSQSFVLIIPSSADSPQIIPTAQQPSADPFQITPKAQQPPAKTSTDRSPHRKNPASTMCFYKTFSFDCGCASQPPAFQSSCEPARAEHRGHYHDFYHHRGPLQGCRVLTITKEKSLRGNCASHILETQIEKRIAQLKDEIKLLKDDIAVYETQMDRERAARRAMNQRYQVHCRGC